ncbi:MAG: asparagine synthase (glutamine-hydrolyzing) [Alphaproteobacteria bacterium]|nr:asparagine synthase (glutamine-hydrolyzing) [Alphaproteobacteria bacterium]
MCGFAAIFAYGAGAPPVDEARLRRIHDAMAARGPDGEGVWLAGDGRLGMAHRRLSIIDLTDGGAQPMAARDAPCRIVFNGEIYNYRALREELIGAGQRFDTESDTEVLLHLYTRHGPEMVRKLRGMFAFAIWDGVRHGVFMARDPYGIKPLYFADDGRTVACASQVKALLAGGGIDTSPEPAGHAGFFMLGYVPEPHTLYRGIEALPSGGSLWIDTSGRGSPRRWFDLTATLREAGEAPFDADALRAALEDSVAHHLVADVPVGAFLSSGLDSATIVSLAAERRGADLRTVTLAFDEFRGTSHDEAPLAAEIAALCGTRHETRPIGREAFEAEAEAVFAAMDQPSIDGVNTYFVSKVTAEAGLKVALSGLGGDELFGGYGSFAEVPRVVNALGVFRFLPGLGRLVRAVSTPLVSRIASPKWAGMIEYGSRWGDAYLLRRGLYMPWELDGLLGRDMAREGLERLALRDRLQETVSGLKTARQRLVALESCWYMRNQLLRDSDWAGMAHSLEIRVPLVDETLLRALAPMLAGPRPPGKRDMALTPGRTLPDSVLDRPKTGFSVPVREWLGGAEGGAAGRGYRPWARLVHDRFGGGSGVAGRGR